MYESLGGHLFNYCLFCKQVELSEADDCWGAQFFEVPGRHCVRTHSGVVPLGLQLWNLLLLLQQLFPAGIQLFRQGGKLLQDTKQIFEHMHRERGHRFAKGQLASVEILKCVTSGHFVVPGVQGRGVCFHSKRSTVLQNTPEPNNNGLWDY